MIQIVIMKRLTRLFILTIGLVGILNAEEPGKRGVVQNPSLRLELFTKEPVQSIGRIVTDQN